MSGVVSFRWPVSTTALQEVVGDKGDFLLISGVIVFSVHRYYSTTVHSNPSASVYTVPGSAMIPYHHTGRVRVRTAQYVCTVSYRVEFYLRKLLVFSHTETEKFP